MELGEKLTKHLKLRQIRMLVAIENCGNIRKAAEFVGLSQPALTKALQELETDIGIQLFERTNRGVVATLYGEVLIKHCNLVLAQLRRAGEELSDLASGHGGRVVVGTLLAASGALLPLATARLRKQRPNVLVSVVEGTNDLLIPRLLRGEVDLIVGRLPELHYRELLENEPLYEETMLIIVGQHHPLASRTSISLEDLLEWGWILPPPQTNLRSQIEKAFFDEGYESPVCAVESVSFLTNKRLLNQSDLIGIWPYHAVKDEIERGMLVGLPISLKPTLGGVGILSSKGSLLTPAVRAFTDELRYVAREFKKDPAGTV